MSVEPRRLSATVLGQLAGGAAALVLGVFPVLAGLGVIDSEGDTGPVARVVAMLFGGVFMTIGGVLVAGPLVALARARGATTWQETVVLGLRHVRRRPSVASVWAALGLVPLAAAYWLSGAGVPIGWLGGTSALRAVVIIEFLVIHGFPFLVMAAWFMGATTGRARMVAGGVFGLLLLLYAAMAWKAADGVGGLVALLYLTGPNVLAFARAASPGSVRVAVTSRWVVKFALFMITTATLGGGSFDGPEAMAVGAAYFSLLVGVELFRIAEIPGDLATAAG